ncbi:hypothetical protein GALL_501800 [mine drainage metagenome]|uniref:Uncharacterized protein n=1 Tax=mine drainage metagenome TaxID=410659 RepID=A0A1J5PBX6_9ZZZZ
MANTGKIKKSPSMRKAKIDASEKLARRSVAVMVVEWGSLADCSWVWV